MKRVVTNEMMKNADMATINNGTPGLVIMEKAARGIYNSIKWQGNILVVCGYGNNAGDGYALAEILHKNGHRVTLLYLARRFSQDGEYYFGKCKLLGIPYFEYNKALSLCGFDIIVDCIFGTGFKGQPEKNASDLISKINESGAFVLSADINSGLNGDNGICEGAVKSNLTVAIGEYKLGHFLGDSKDYIENLTKIDIGIDVSEGFCLVEGEDAKKLLFTRRNHSNKGTYGYLSIIGGSVKYSGAVKLANLAASAMRAGAGVVRLCVPNEIVNGVMPYTLESTIYPLKSENGYIKFDEKETQGALNSTRAVAIGMGLGQEGDGEALIKYILENYEGNIVIDADGLNILSKMDLSILKKAKGAVVLTPHLKELERLSGVELKEIENNPVYYAKAFAKENGIILLLKGPTTIVTDGEKVYLVNRGTAGMATAGSGDVLSGILAGLLATTEKRTPIESVYLGAYINGLAGEIASKEIGEISMLASDTVSKIAEAIKEIQK